LRYQEAPLKKAEFVTFDDPEDSDEPKEKKQGNLDGRKMENDKLKKKAEFVSLRELVN
jgi:hypothetical protein